MATLNNALVLKDKADELRVLLMEINDLYEPDEDEFLNEMFFSSLYKAREFSKTLDYVLRKVENNNDSV